VLLRESEMRRIILPLLVLTILGACHKPNSLDGNLVKKPPMNTAGGVDAPGVDSGGGMNKPPKKPAVIEQPPVVDTSNPQIPKEPTKNGSNGGGTGGMGSGSGTIGAGVITGIMAGSGTVSAGSGTR